MSGIKPLVRGAALSALSVCISMVALLVTSKLFTNALDQESVGIFALLLVSADFIIYASGMGLAASMPKLVAEADTRRQRQIIGSALAWQTTLLLGLGCLTLLAQALIREPERLTSDPSWLGVHAHLHLLPLLFIVGGLRDAVMAMLAGLDRYGYRAAGIAAASIAQVVLVYVAVWRLGGGLAALTLSMAAAYGLALLLLWIGLGVNGVPLFAVAPYLKSIRFSAPLYVNQVMNFFNQRFDTVLVSMLAGVPQAAVYEMVKRLPVIVNRVMNALLTPYLPHISRLVSVRDYAGAARILAHAVNISAFVGYGAALGMVAVQHLLIVLLFNEEYLPGAPALGLLLIAASLALQSGLMAQMLIALGKNMVVPLVNFGAVIISIAANLVIIPRFGIVGAGWVAIACAGFSYLMQAVFTHRAGIPVQFGQCLKPLLLLLLSWAPIAYGQEHLGYRLAAPLLFAVLCFVCGVVSPRQLYRLGQALLPDTQA